MFFYCEFILKNEKPEEAILFILMRTVCNDPKRMS